MVLTTQQQSNIARVAGPSVFRAAGVPGVQRHARFAEGGIAPSGSAQGEPATVVIEELVLVHGMSQSGAEELFVRGGSSRRGQQLLVKSVKVARLNQELS
jgi:hypothetical protein